MLPGFRDRSVHASLRRAALLLGVLVVGGVLVSRQCPALTNGPKSSTEMLASLFAAPVSLTANAARFALGRVSQEAVVAFLRVLDAPADVKARAIALVSSDSFDRVTTPFVLYLYDLYGAAAVADDVATADLAYAEAAAPESTSPGMVSLAVRHPVAIRRHAGNALRLFDALFLRVRPGAGPDLPVADRYDPAAYAEVRAVVRDIASQFLGPPDDAKHGARNEYAEMLETTIRDDARLAVFVEFFTDLIRDLTDRWLQSFVRREQRKAARAEWTEARIRANRYYEIADYARRQAERRLAIHLVVDGLQGKLLEGLVQLSSGDRSGSGARYVVDLVRQHRGEDVQRRTAGGALPAPLGQHIVELAERAPVKPDYLENFRQYFFAPDAPAVVVNVATVDTPSISVRNLPIVYSGHGVAGPHGTGIPNFSYLDRRTERGWYFWGSDVLHMRDIFANREDQVPRGTRRDGPGARTLMERLWRLNTVSAVATIDLGALEIVSSEVGMGVGELWRNFIEKVLIQKFRRRAGMERQLNERRRWLVDHRQTSDSLIASLFTSPSALATFRDHARFIAEHEDEGLPDYLLWYNPWPDHFAHGKGPYSDAILGEDGEYDRLDFYLGRMMAVYESVPAVSGLPGTYADRTLVGVVSDHGLVYTPELLSTDERLFESMRRDGVDIRYLKLTHDEGGLPSIHARHDVKPTRGYDAVVGSTAGGSYIIDLFASGSAGASGGDWVRHPGYHALRKLTLIGGQTIDFVDRLKRHLGEAMDFAVVREESGSQPAGVVRIFNTRGEARIHRLAGSDAAPGSSRYRYEVLEGEDPLELAGAVRDFLIPPGGPSVPEARAAIAAALASPNGLAGSEWQTLLSFTLRPDVVYQLSHLYDSDRAGTVNVFPTSRVGMNSSVPGRHAGEAFGEKNGAQLYRGPGLTRATVQTARNGSLPVTIFHWLVGDAGFRESGPDGPLADQFGYPTLLGEPAFAPLQR